MFCVESQLSGLLFFKFLCRTEDSTTARGKSIGAKANLLPLRVKNGDLGGQSFEQRDRRVDQSHWLRRLRDRGVDRR